MTTSDPPPLLSLAERLILDRIAMNRRTAQIHPSEKARHIAEVRVAAYETALLDIAAARMTEGTITFSVPDWHSMNLRFERKVVAMHALKARIRLLEADGGRLRDRAFGYVTRCSGDDLCSCGRPCSDHPAHPDQAMQILCDGTLVKL